MRRIAIQMTRSSRSCPNTPIEIHYDNIEVVAENALVPEPATILLFGLVGLFL